MNERQLSSFILAAQCKSFSKAADAAFISPPAFIQQINLLEESLGFELFYRTNKGISLTPAGKYFYKSALEILKIYNNSIEVCRKYQENEPPITIASPRESFPDFLFDAYKEYLKDYPDHQVSFISLPFGKQLAACRSNEIDICIIAEPNECFMNDLTFVPLCKDVYSFCMRKEHPLAIKKKITLHDLKKSKILCGDYPYLEHQFIDVFSDYSETQVIPEYDSTILSSVLASDSIFVIHSLWSKSYTPYLKVIPSDIDAGYVGIVKRKVVSSKVDRFISYFTGNRA